MLNTFVRRSLLGVALAGLVVTGAAQAQNKDAAKDAVKAEKDATKDAANAQKDATKDAGKAQKDAVKDAKVKNPDNDKNKGKHAGEVKGKHTAKGHSH